MKKIKLFIYITLLLSGSSVKSQIHDKSFIPAVYYTYGSYSNSANSKGLAFYGTYKFNYNDYITAAYEKLNIDNPGWTYDQNYFVIGGLKNLYPFYLKINYAHVSGDFSFKPFRFFYTDNINLGNINLLYNWQLFYFGVGATVQSLKGFENITTQYYEFKLTWVPTAITSFTIKPGFTKTNDGRSEFAVASEIFYQPADFINFSLLGFIGKRVFYFDPDYLTIFNQPQTQKNSFSILSRLFVNTPFNVIAAYQYSDFTEYTIRYYTLGLKYNIEY